MSGTPSKTGSNIAALVVLVPVLILGWFVLPFVLPMWRWQKVDFEDLARKNLLMANQLSRTYEVVVRHAPRGEGDPCPWQLLSSEPDFDGYGKPDFESEKHLMVRCTFVSERTGDGPSALYLGSGSFQDKYFKATVWRLPAGSLGFTRNRPVLIYAGSSLEKLDRTGAMNWESSLKEGGENKFENDDADIDDGWHRPGSAE